MPYYQKEKKEARLAPLKFTNGSFRREKPPDCSCFRREAEKRNKKAASVF
jgi:hypothetical protein